MALLNLYRPKAKALSSIITAHCLECDWHLAPPLPLPKQITAPTDPLRLEYRILMGDIPEFTEPKAIVAIHKKRICQARTEFVKTAWVHISSHLATRD